MTDDKRGKLIETLLELAEEFAVPSIPPDTYRTCRTADLIRAVDSMRAAAAALQPSIAPSVAIERVKAWFYSKPRKQAQAAFTAGD